VSAISEREPSLTTLFPRFQPDFHLDHIKIAITFYQTLLGMASAQDIPPEIWSVIFDLALDASVTPRELCTYHNFLQLNRHFRSSRFYPPLDHSWENLRLVCHAFKALAGSSPHCFLRRGFVIPTSTRAVYIGVSQNIVGRMERLARSSSIKHHQIVTLNIIRGYSQNPTGQSSLSFLEYASALPNLHTLAVDFDSTIDPSSISTWRRLNDAFPLLTCLVLRGGLRGPNTSLDASEPVVFERMEILELDRLIPGLRVEFPKLRYLSLEIFSDNEREVVAGWPGIEALVLRGMTQGVSLDWKRLPNLRMLGIPGSHLWALARCPLDRLGAISVHLFPRIGSRDK
jgi:hypothetical protein